MGTHAVGHSEDSPRARAETRKEAIQGGHPRSGARAPLVSGRTHTKQRDELRAVARADEIDVVRRRPQRRPLEKGDAGLRRRGARDAAGERGDAEVRVAPDRPKLVEVRCRQTARGVRRKRRGDVGFHDASRGMRGRSVLEALKRTGAPKLVKSAADAVGPVH